MSHSTHSGFSAAFSERGCSCRITWADRLEDGDLSRKAAGFKVEANLKGLGEVPGVRDLFVDHAKQNVDDLTKEPKKQ